MPSNSNVWDSFKHVPITFYLCNCVPSLYWVSGRYFSERYFGEWSIKRLSIHFIIYLFLTSMCVWSGLWTSFQNLHHQIRKMRFLLAKTYISLCIMFIAMHNIAKLSRPV